MYCDILHAEENQDYVKQRAQFGVICLPPAILHQQSYS